MARSPDKARRRAVEGTVAAVLLLRRKATRDLSGALDAAALDAARRGLSVAEAEAGFARAAEQAVLEARRAGRALGRRSVERLAGGAPGAAAPLPALDLERAADSAASLAGQLSGSVQEGEILTGERAQALYRAVVRREAAAVERTAATEALDAANREIREVGDRLARETGRTLVRVWNCAAEANTCDLCLSHEDEQVVGDEEFSDGDPTLHPNCLCWVETYLR